MHKSFIDLFEQQVSKTPGNVAVVFENKRLTYHELDEQAAKLASYLRSKGVKEDSLVPLFIERSLQMIVAMIGIMKAGGAYVPIDTEFPVDRISFILKDTKAALVISSHQASSKLPADAHIEIVDIDAIPAVKDMSSIKIGGNQLAYVIYTSGSTGMPKGVMIEHRSLVDYTEGLIEKIQINDCASFALVSTIATDLGNTVIYGALATGGVLHVFTKESVSNIEYLHAYFGANKIDCLKIVPSHWKVLNMDDQLLLPEKLLVFGGEALQEKVIKEIQASGSQCRVVNHYGPTETTIGKLLHVVEPGAKYEYNVPIGKPFSNTKVLILNNNLKLCPKGVAGQLYITGDGIARGYLNNEELTKEKFIQNPFSKESHSIMYSTGDLVKYLPDGNVSFIGRVDNQVKIRGYRIELGEIESVLVQCPLVSQAAVLAKEDKQENKSLIAYIIPNNSFDRDGIIEYLEEKLPEYMMPAFIMEMESFPLTPNGKIDRNALPDPDVNEVVKDQYVAPRNETEAKLAEIWQDVLELDQVGVTNDFFELGGHSLLAVRLVSAIRKTFSVEMPIGNVFDYPTVEELAGQLLKNTGNAVNKPIEAIIPKPLLIPLSFSQERLWFIDRFEGSVRYHVPTVLRLKGTLNIDALTFALQNIINRHEVLRSVIFEEEDQAYQKVKDSDKWELSIVDGSSFDSPSLQKYIQQSISEPFDLSNDYMLRASLITLQPDEHILVTTLHHIASDAWSKSILVKEVAELYNSFEEGRSANLKPLAVQYADYAIWQRTNLTGEIFDKKLAYWKNKLDNVKTLQLPTDYKRPAVWSDNGASQEFTIEKELSQQLTSLSQKHGATLFMTLLAAFKVLLHRYSGQNDICVGTPIAGRQQAEIENLIGFFINTLALRSDVVGNNTFTELLSQVKSTTLAAYDHQEVPFEKVVEAVLLQRDISRSPLFQVMFVLRNTPEIEELKLGDINLSAEGSSSHTAKFELTFSVNETEDGLQCSVEYNTGLYKDETIQRMVSHYRELLKSVVKTPEEKVGKLKMLTGEEEQQLLIEFNDNATEYPKDKSIIDLFEELATITPGDIAVLFEEEQVTYKELNEKSNQLAHFLRKNGVREETLVPVCIERGIGMMTAILGILKAGGAYVPLDPGYPKERINYMLEDTSASIVLASTATIGNLPERDHGETIILDKAWDEINSESTSNLNKKIAPDSLAYVIYTSGSTGKPKGVLVEQGNVVSLVKGVDYVSLTEEDRLLSTGSSSFDATTLEYWGMLLNGGQLVLCEEEKLLNSDLLKEEIISREITKMWFTSSWLNQLVENDITIFKSLKTILAGGEKLSEQHIQKIRQTYPDIEIINGYGPTENTTFSLTHKITETNITSTIPIGRPLNNRNAYILNDYGQLAPIGVPGEILLGGAGLSRGYLNQPALTAEKFIVNPFGKEESRLYKTGDLGRWLSNGTIEYLGRKDDQVKIRGYRIELGEIESVIQQNDKVKQAVVLAKEDSHGNKRLVGYIVSEGNFDKEALVVYLQKKLPDYMVPQAWVALEQMPLTSNGKIDKQSLPEPDALLMASNEYEAPSTELEEQLTGIWQQLLGIQQIGINDNFFELGGHSLLAMRMVSAMRRQLNIEMPVKDIFMYPTIRQLAGNLPQQGKEILLSPIKIIQRPEHIPLSFSQERLWFIDQLEGSLQYHVPTILRLKGELDKEALSNSLQEIVNRHEVLRTVFVESEDGKPYQQVKETGLWELKQEDGSIYKEDEASLQKYIQSLILEPFDLSKDDMLRATLVYRGEQEHILVTTMHHIASDGWSMGIIIKEVVSLYQSYSENKPVELPPLEIQYADYSIWQRDYLKGEVLQEKLGYWKEKLSGVASLEMPTDFPRPVTQTSKGASTRFIIEKRLSEQLQELSRQEEATLFMTLLSALNVLLYRYSGQEDVCVGTPIANRTRQETESLIGFFINTLALRTGVSAEKSFSELLKQVKVTTLEAYSHQEVPFEKVVEAVVKERDLGRSPLFQVMLVLQNTPQSSEIGLGELQIVREVMPSNTAKFDLAFSMTENEDGLLGSLEYNRDLYKPETIDQIIIHFEEILRSVVQDPQQKISGLQMLTSQEENQLLIDFNDTAISYPAEKTILDLFTEQAIKTPDRVAVVFEQEEITYLALDQQSNQLAHYLQRKGVKQETLVPICIERGIGMMTGILGILKAGGAYVPIDPAYPAERINYMQENTAARIILSSEASKDKLQEQAAEVIAIDTDWEQISKETNDGLKIKIDQHSLAYVIYTSGSTGRPKGVMIEHRNLYSFIKWCQHEFAEDKFEIVYASTSMCFDLSVFEFFYPLTVGKKIRLLQNGLEIGDYLAKDNAVLINSVPVVIENLLKEEVDFKNVSIINMAGEPISAYVQKNLDVEKIVVRNLYGPTEDTTYSTVFKLQKDKKVTIGRPIANTSVLILSKDESLLPVGIPGEICLAGDGLARGYLNRDDLTDERFIYYVKQDQQKIRLYKTGDIGCWLPDGSIEYIGRMDSQVKIRGYRVELGEIETTIFQTGLVKQAVVSVKEDKNGSKRLVGYIVTEGLVDREVLMSQLRKSLPEYMIPFTWVELAEMPLTANGKIDKKALPDPEAHDLTGNEFIAPGNEMEEKLSEIWKALLGVEQVGINDNFFELGGDSILTIQVVSRAKRFGYNLQPKDIFVHQTIKKLSQAIAQKSAAAVSGEQGLLTGAAKLLPIQQWYFDIEQSNFSHFNQKLLLKIDKSITGALLGEVIEQLSIQHDALRFKYSRKENCWNQEYGTALPKVIVENIDESSAANISRSITELSNKYQQSLDIEEGDLVRVVLIQTPESETHNRILIVIHHLAIDGVSWRVLVEDMEELLSGLIEGKKVDPGYKTSSYRQWYEALENYSRSERLLSQEKYWQKTATGDTLLNLDKDYSGVVKLKDIASVQVTLDSEQTRALLQEVPRAYHTEINDILLCALAKTLCDWNEDSKIIIGMEGHGREEINDNVDISKTVGWFTSMYPVLLDLNTSDAGLDNLIKSVKEQMRLVPDKGLGYGVLKYINKEEVLKAAAPFEIIFNYLGQVDNVARESKWFSGAEESAGESRSPKMVVTEKLSINSIIRGGELGLTWFYSTKHFKEDTIQNIATTFITNLESLIDHCLQQQKAGETYTPSDYGLGEEISFEELDQFLNERS